MATLIIPTLILLLGVINDLKSRKVKNGLVVVCALLGLAHSYYFFGTAGLFAGLLAAAAAFVCALPLVMMNILGAGDLKLFTAFGFATTWYAVLVTGFASLVWGALLGLLRALFQGELLLVLKNTWGVAKRQAPEKLHVIPFTVALLLGWLTYLTLYGGVL